MEVTARVARWPLLAGALVAALAGPRPAAAQDSARKSYNQGLEAIAAQDWTAAAEALRQAIAVQGEERRSALGRPYLPHLHLGIALGELGSCEQALAALAESERQGVVARYEENVEQLGQSRERCERRLAELAALAAQVQEALAGARAASDRVASLARTSLLSTVWAEGTPSLRDRQTEADSQLARAEELLADPEDDLLAARQSALALVRSASESLARLRSDATAIYRRRLSAAQSERARLDEIALAISQAREEAFDLLEATAYLAPFPSQLGSLREALERSLADAESVPEQETVEHYEEVQAQLRLAVEELARAAEAPQNALIEAATDYFRGDYDRALARLGEVRPRSRRERAHLLLLSAAARFSLYRSEGGRRADLIEAARLDVDGCRRADRSLSPPSRLFSPEFLRFFETAGGGSG